MARTKHERAQRAEPRWRTKWVWHDTCRQPPICYDRNVASMGCISSVVMTESFSDGPTRPNIVSTLQGSIIAMFGSHD